MLQELLLLVFLCVLSALAVGDVVDFVELGGIPGLTDLATQQHNGALLNNTLNYGLKTGDTLVIPNATFSIMGGILVTTHLKGITFQLEGTLSYSTDRDKWPREGGADGHVLECLNFEYIEDFVFTSSGGPDNRGTMDGNGQIWWGAIQYLLHQEDRPRLIRFQKSKNVLFEKILLKDSPFWTFWAQNCDGLEVRNSEIDARWDQKDKHTYLDLQAFNTDGFDVTGQYVWIHDVTVWNDDDCVCVKDDSQHMLFERITASGLGLVVGSIGSSVVHNITFRDAYMYKTVKGIYMKTRWNDEGPADESVASITDILFENITMIEPQQFAIWIGPAQQSGQPCSLLWPHKDAVCEMSGYQTWRNITLKDIYIESPRQSPGVIMGNATNPITGLTLENVVFKDMNGRMKPWGQEYFCSKGGVEGTVSQSSPEPDCLAQPYD